MSAKLLCIKGSRRRGLQAGLVYTQVDHYLCPCGKNPDGLVSVAEVRGLNPPHHCRPCGGRVRRGSNGWFLARRFIPWSDDKLGVTKREVTELYTPTPAKVLQDGRTKRKAPRKVEPMRGAHTDLAAVELRMLAMLMFPDSIAKSMFPSDRGREGCTCPRAIEDTTSLDKVLQCPVHGVPPYRKCSCPASGIPNQWCRMHGREALRKRHNPK